MGLLDAKVADQIIHQNSFSGFTLYWHDRNTGLDQNVTIGNIEEYEKVWKQCRDDNFWNMTDLNYVIFPSLELWVFIFMDGWNWEFQKFEMLDTD